MFILHPRLLRAIFENVMLLIAYNGGPLCYSRFMNVKSDPSCLFVFSIVLYCNVRLTSRANSVIGFACKIMHYVSIVSRIAYSKTGTSLEKQEK